MTPSCGEYLRHASPGTLSDHEQCTRNRIEDLEQTLRDVRAIAESQAGNWKYMQVAGPARRIINRVNRVLPKGER